MLIDNFVYKVIKLVCMQIRATFVKQIYRYIMQQYQLNSGDNLVFTIHANYINNYVHAYNIHEFIKT